jgi:hypothetical protein
MRESVFGYESRDLDSRERGGAFDCDLLLVRKTEEEHSSRMPEDIPEKRPTGANPDEIALELMKFIAVTTGYGRGTPTTGFGGKGSRSTEEYTESLLELFERCRAAVRKT